MIKEICIRGIYKNNKKKEICVQASNECNDFTLEEINTLALLLHTQLKPIKGKFKYIEIDFYIDNELFHDNKFYSHDILEQDANKVAKEIIELYKYYLIRL